MLKGFVNALFPQIHTQSNYDFKARDMKKGLSQSKIEKPDSEHAAMGIGERTKKGAPAPGKLCPSCLVTLANGMTGQGSAPKMEIGEPSEPSEMSPEEKKQLQGSDPTFAGKETMEPKSKL